MKNLQITTDGVTVVIKKNEPRTSHRDIAESLGILPKNAMQQINAYKSDFEAVGIVLFKTEKIKRSETRGRGEETAYLNEDQCFLLLSFSKNTAIVRAAKVRMIKAFSQAREQLAQRATQYLPMHHAAHDEISIMVETAKAHGSVTPESIHHMNYEKLINKAFSIDPNSRSTLDSHTQSAITAAYTTIKTTLKHAATQGLEHKTAYRLVKHNVAQLAGMMGFQRLGVSA